MKNLITLTFLCGALTAFGQVGPTSGTQGAVTGGATVTTQTPAALAGVSMQDIDRLHGPYANGFIDAQGDEIKISYTDQMPSQLDFEGIVVVATTLILELDGFDKVSGSAMQIQITAAPDNQAQPKELYHIRQFGSNDVWILTEDPFNPK